MYNVCLLYTSAKDHLSDGAVTDGVLGRLDRFVEELSGERFARLVMLGEQFGDHLGLEEIVFHKLARELHKVTLHIGSRHGAVACLREQAVE